MRKYIKNITTSIICFLVICVLNFALPRLLPGNPVAYLTGMDEATLTDEKIQFYEDALHINEPIRRQFGFYVGTLLDGSLGYSYKKECTVSELIGERLGNTMQICLSAALISAALGLVLGLSAGYKNGKAIERVQTGAQIVLNAFPTFLIALVLVILLCFKGRIFPYSGLGGGEGLSGFFDRIRHLFLPVLTLVIAQTPSRYLAVKNAAANALGEKYVLYARQRGLSARAIKYSYILKSIAPPYIAMIGTGIGGCLGGSVVVESIFSVNGMGRLLSDAVYTLDYPLMQGVLFTTALIMVAAIILTDIVCILLDPRTLAGGSHEE